MLPLPAACLKLLKQSLCPVMDVSTPAISAVQCQLAIGFVLPRAEMHNCELREREGGYMEGIHSSKVFCMLLL